MQKASVRKTNKTNQPRDPEHQPKPQPPPSPLPTQHKMEAAPQRCAVLIGWEPLKRSCQSTLSPAPAPKSVYMCVRPGVRRHFVGVGRAVAAGYRSSLRC